MEEILPDLYKETTIKLKREVEMGPFKYPVDDALDNRKAAFECMYTVLQSCMDRVNIFQFLDHIEIGLKDVPDIKMLTYLMVLRLVHINPNAIMLKLESILEPARHIPVQTEGYLPYWAGGRESPGAEEERNESCGSSQQDP